MIFWPPQLTEYSRVHVYKIVSPKLGSMFSSIGFRWTVSIPNFSWKFKPNRLRVLFSDTRNRAPAIFHPCDAIGIGISRKPNCLIGFFYCSEHIWSQWLHRNVLKFSIRCLSHKYFCCSVVQKWDWTASDHQKVFTDRNWILRLLVFLPVPLKVPHWWLAPHQSP